MNGCEQVQLNRHLVEAISTWFPEVPCPSTTLQAFKLSKRKCNHLQGTICDKLMFGLLHADRLSPFKFYQYLLTNVADAEVIKFLRMLTFVPLDELETLERSMQEPGYKPNTAQRLLAGEVTRFVHGQQGLDQALKATEVNPCPCISKKYACDVQPFLFVLL